MSPPVLQRFIAMHDTWRTEILVFETEGGGDWISVKVFGKYGEENISLSSGDMHLGGIEIDLLRQLQLFYERHEPPNVIETDGTMFGNRGSWYGCLQYDLPEFVRWCMYECILKHSPVTESSRERDGCASDESADDALLLLWAIFGDFRSQHPASAAERHPLTCHQCMKTSGKNLVHLVAMNHGSTPYDVKEQITRGKKQRWCPSHRSLLQLLRPVFPLCPIVSD